MILQFSSRRQILRKTPGRSILRREVARQCHADADVDTAAAIVAPTNIAMRKRLMITPLFYELRHCQRSKKPPIEGGL
jgi:hypothetical protein